MSLELLTECMELQDKFNKRVNPEWKAAMYPWYRATWIECAELVDWLGWKWWKKQEPNIEQAKIELVDIFHFVLSDSIELGYAVTSIHGAFKKSERLIALNKKKTELSNLVESYANAVLETENTQLSFFAEVVSSFGMTLEELCELYIAKNVLNNFRQANGYKEGTYIKMWGEQEDNQVLEYILDSMETPIYEEIYNQLTLHYEGVKANETK